MSATAFQVPLRIVGIGTSAGGLNALDQFFKNVPDNSGLAFIVVQHLDPTKKALLAELLQRSTTLRVRQAYHNLVVKPNQVYVIPPNRELSLLNGKLQLAATTEVGGLRLPVNVLFFSLAKELGDKAIGVILSGMGSDGTLGLKAIKEQGGLTLAQTPESAQFDSMPQSAINAACVDIAAACEELPLRILAALDGLQIDRRFVSVDVNKNDESVLVAILRLLRAHTRHDFSLYKSNTLLRRIERRVAVHGLCDLRAYLLFLEQNSSEMDLLFKELLIGVTSFFRDPPVWDYLEKFALPALLNELPRPYRFRAWCVGCSTGEEAYSLVMVFCDVIEQLPDKKSIEIQIFASDLSLDAISFARRGRYPMSVANQISPERLAKYFTLRNDHYLINQTVRDRVLFAQHNVVLDPPFTKLDLLICRNLLIYFDAELQQRLFPLFHYSLKSSGLLLLGSSETVGNMASLFDVNQPKLRLYQQRDKMPFRGASLLLSAFPPISPTIRGQVVPKTSLSTQRPNQNLQTAADHVLLQVYAPAAVVVNADSDIVYISGRTGKYLEPAAGKANWNFHAMVRDGLRAPLFNALKKAAVEGQTIELHGLQVEQSDPESIVVDVTVQKLHEPSVLKGMFIIVFRDAGLMSDRQHLADVQVDGGQVAYVEELRRQQEENQRLRDENRASQEELQLSNEELQSTNEELQSTNEELTTSKEEMQSMNEELQTINSELQAKLDDLALAQSDMQNLLNSTEIAILFLDGQLNVRRYTERAAKIISLRESDVGRPLSDLSSVMSYPALNDDAVETLRTLVFSEKEVSSTDGRTFLVRIMPYKRLDNVIDGVVITFMVKSR